MKRVALAAVCLLSACESRSDPSTRHGAVTTGLVAAWGFDDGSGTVAHDATANHLDGALSTQTWSTGKYGGALVFGSGYVTVPDAPALDLTTGMTVEAWVNPSDDAGSWRMVAAKERPGDLAYGMYAWDSSG